MLVLDLRHTRIRAWRGYTQVRRREGDKGFLPKRMALLAPAASLALEEMQAACDDAIEVTDGYRSVAYQIRCRREQKAKRRLFAPPTKSGHNFGRSIDVKVKETLENLRASRDPRLVAAGRDRASLGRWMAGFGWTGIRSESWHFNFLEGHASTVQLIDEVYGEALTPDNARVQEALNRLLGNKLPAPLVIDGILGSKSHAAGLLADQVLDINDRGDFGPWFRRVLAGAAAEVREV